MTTFHQRRTAASVAYQTAEDIQALKVSDAKQTAAVLALQEQIDPLATAIAQATPDEMEAVQ